MSRTRHHHHRQEEVTNSEWRRECIHKPEKQKARRALKAVVEGQDPEDVYVPNYRHKHFSGYWN